MLRQSTGTKKQRTTLAGNEKKAYFDGLSTDLKKLVISFLSIDAYANFALASKSINKVAKLFVKGINWFAPIKKAIELNEELGLDHHSKQKKKKIKEQLMPLTELKANTTEFIKFTSLASRRLVLNHDELKPLVMNQKIFFANGSLRKEVIAVLDDITQSEDVRRKKLINQMPVFHRTTSILQEAEAAKKSLSSAREKLQNFKTELERQKETSKLNSQKKKTKEEKNEKSLTASQQKQLEDALTAAEKKYDELNELLFFIFQLNTSKIALLANNHLKVKSMLDRKVEKSTLVYIKRLAPAWNNYRTRYLKARKAVSELMKSLDDKNVNEEAAKKKLQEIKASLDMPMLFADDKPASPVMTLTQYFNVGDAFKQDNVRAIVTQLDDELSEMKQPPIFFESNIKKEDVWRTKEVLVLWAFTDAQLALIPGWRRGHSQQNCYLTRDLIKARLARVKRCAIS